MMRVSEQNLCGNNCDIVCVEIRLSLIDIRITSVSSVENSLNLCLQAPHGGQNVPLSLAIIIFFILALGPIFETIEEIAAASAHSVRE